MHDPGAMGRYGVEMVGTFFLVLAIGLSAQLEGALTAPLAIGAVLMAAIYAGGHVSFAHYNPAVTLSFLLRGRMPKADVAPYVVAQLVGTGLAVACTTYLLPDSVVAPLAAPLGPLMVAEILFTFALCWVILNVATSAGTQGNDHYALAIAALVTGAILVVGPISGAVLNPAVAAGLCMMDRLPWHSLWAYVVAQVTGALLANLAFKIWVRE